MRLFLFLFFLIIIAVLSTFYVPASLLRIEASIYNNTASPYCIDWMGTSIFVNILKNNNITVDIVDNPSDLEDSLKIGGLVIVIAPDRLISDNDSILIKKYFDNGTISIAVFDENITSNNLLKLLGVKIDGRLLLDPYTPDSPYYPISEINLTGFRAFVRLNWASYIQRMTAPNLYDVIVFSKTMGVVDRNNNGVLDPDEISDSNAIKTYTTGVIMETRNSTIMIFSDSYPLINSAFIHNYTLTNTIMYYLIEIAREKNGRVIFPNYYYRTTSIEATVPFHFSTLLLLFANLLHYLDNFLNNIIYSSNYIYIGFLTLMVLAITFLLRNILGITSVAEYKSTSLIEQGILVETLATKNLRNKNVLEKREKTIILNTWRILKNAYTLLRNIDIEECISRKNYKLLIELRILDEHDFKQLEKLYKIYLKAAGKKRLPIIFNWRKTVFKYIAVTEYFLNKIGCSLIRKKGYKDAAYLVKKQF
ncbi:MAG: DUF4350 domain-containing protein [Staphylothermus sp.]|nr:DUF4350 domain-containing protein [Staphylothermus sp.]